MRLFKPYSHVSKIRVSFAIIVFINSRGIELQLIWKLLVRFEVFKLNSNHANSGCVKLKQNKEIVRFAFICTWSFRISSTYPDSVMTFFRSLVSRVAHIAFNQVLSSEQCDCLVNFF